MARSFDNASSEYIEVDSSPVTAYPFTMSCWFRTDDLVNEQAAFFVLDKDTAFERHGLILRVQATGDPLEAFADGIGDEFRALSTSGISANTWHHGVGLFEGTQAGDVTVFLDGGSSKATAVAHTSDVTSFDRTSIGRAGDSTPGSYMSGDVAEAAIWNVSLTTAEIAALAAGYSPLMVRPNALVFYAPLIRDADRDIIGGLSMTAFNTPSVIEHPRVINPAPPRYWFVAPAAGGITETVNQALETDLAQAIAWTPKHRLLNQVQETSLAQAMVHLKALSIGQVTETDIAQSLSKLKSLAVGQVSETNLAQAIVRLKLVALARASETDLAQAVARLKALGMDQATETDTAQALGKLKSLAVGQVSETDIAQAITVLGEIIVALNQASEIDTVGSISWSPKHRLLGQVTESDIAQAFSTLKSLAIGQATETGLAQSIGILKAVTLGQATETDLSQAITLAGAIIVALGQATEADVAQAVGRIKQAGLGQVSEADLAQAISRVKQLGLNRVAETDTAQVVSWSPKHRLVGQAEESDLALTIVLASAGIIAYPVIRSPILRSSVVRSRA